MSTNFDLSRDVWDDHVRGDGPHIGLTRPGFDRPELDVAYRTLIKTGHSVDDGGIENTPRGKYGELAIDRDLTKKAEKRLRRLGFTGLNELTV
ncbi:hypothetical protein HYS84_02480 [Candidatus Saccharibacteria bacterium]|nr:hypothetical protein [Candidatus Saccharibacteria bacterium]